VIRSEEHVPRKMVLDAIVKMTDAAKDYVLAHDLEIEDDLGRVALCGWTRSRLMSALPLRGKARTDYIDAILEAAGGQ
jgi:hypothetical protein